MLRLHKNLSLFSKRGNGGDIATSTTTSTTTKFASERRIAEESDDVTVDTSSGAAYPDDDVIGTPSASRGVQTTALLHPTPPPPPPPTAYTIRPASTRHTSGTTTTTTTTEATTDATASNTTRGDAAIGSASSDGSSYTSDGRYRCHYPGEMHDERLARIKTKVFRGHRKDVTCCDFVTDDVILSGSADESVITWDVKTGDIIKVYDGAHRARVTHLVVSPDTESFASTGWDKKVRMWDLETSNLIWTGGHNGLVTYCSFSSDGQRLVTCTDRDNVVVIWDARTGHVKNVMKDLHKSTITSVQFTLSGERLLTTSYDRTAVISDLVSNTATATLRGHTNIIADASITRDERWVATVSWDKSINLYDITIGMYREKGPRTIEKAHEGCISCCDFSADGSLLVTGGYDLRVCVWDVNELTRRHKLQGHTDWVVDVKFNSDSSFILSCAKDTQLRLWNIGDEVITDVNPDIVFKQRAFQETLENCTGCGKTFSVTYEHVKQGVKDCVLCRIKAEPTDYAREFED